MGNLFSDDFRDFILCLNKCKVNYLLIGGYSVVLHGYPRTTGDMDIWVKKSSENYSKLIEAFKKFKMPMFDMTSHNFMSDNFDVFRFGLPPQRIDILTSVKGVRFDECHQRKETRIHEDLELSLISKADLIVCKKAANRPRDINDLENLK